MSKSEIESIIKISDQYLHPDYNPKAPGGLKAQIDAEEGNIKQVVTELTRRDQNVSKIWKPVQKIRRSN